MRRGEVGTRPEWDQRVKAAEEIGRETGVSEVGAAQGIRGFWKRAPEHAAMRALREGAHGSNAKRIDLIPLASFPPHEKRQFLHVHSRVQSITWDLCPCRTAIRRRPRLLRQRMCPTAIQSG